MSRVRARSRSRVAGSSARRASASFNAPGAIVYPRYGHTINSTALVTRMRVEKSVLIVPGDHFGMDGYLRIGFGDQPDRLRQGLTHLHDLLCSISS